MVGRLARYLRLLGFDTEYLRVSDETLLVLQARKENRIILTRSNRLKDLSEVFFITTEQPEEQLQQVIARYGLRDKTKFFTRCLLCNKELVPVKKEVVAGKVPYFTYKNFSKFSQCPNCERIYWEGSHYENMKKKIETIFAKREL